jgi:hypothetical protein
MSSPEQISVLVRAFKAAWEFYFQPDRDTTVLECLARPALAQFLVDKTKEGITDEPSLAAAGLEYLFSLEDPPEDLEDAPEDIVAVSADAPDLVSADAPDLASDALHMEMADVLGDVLHLENAGARFMPVSRVRTRFH